MTSINAATNSITVMSTGQLGSGDLSLASGGTVTLENSSQTIGNLLASNVSNAIINMAGSLTINQTTNLTYTGTLADYTGSHGMLILGTGTTATVTLSGSNITYTGGTQVLGGVLTVASGSSLGGSTTAPLTVNAWLNLNNTAQGVGNLNGTSTGVITLASATTLTVTQTSFGFYNGIITASQGVGGSLVLGSGTTSTLTLGGANNYNGGTQVLAGTLYATNASALGVNGGLSIANGAAFAYQPTAAGVLSLGSGVIMLVNGSTIGAAVGGAGRRPRKYPARPLLRSAALPR